MKNDKMQSARTITAGLPVRQPPERLIEWLRQEILQGANRFELHQRSAVVVGGLAVAIQPFTEGHDFDKPNDADDLAQEIYRRAVDEHQQCPAIGTNGVVVVCYRKGQQAAASSLGFRVMPEGLGEHVGALEGPSALEVIKQTQRHLEEREVVQQAMLLEGISAIHVGRNDTSAAWKELAKGYRELADATKDNAKTFVDEAREDGKRKNERIKDLEARQLENMVLFEQLASHKQEREIEVLKVTRKLDRQDQAFKGIFLDKIVPALLVRFGGALGKIGVDVTKKPGGTPSGGAGGGTAAEGSAVSKGVGDVAGQVDGVFLTRARAIALQNLFAGLTGDDLLAIRGAVSPETRERLQVFIEAFSDDAEPEAESATTTGEETNGHSSNGAANGTSTNGASA
jgi:hypothetical protein